MVTTCKKVATLSFGVNDEERRIINFYEGGSCMVSQRKRFHRKQWRQYLKYHCAREFLDCIGFFFVIIVLLIFLGVFAVVHIPLTPQLRVYPDPSHKITQHPKVSQRHPTLDKYLDKVRRGGEPLERRNHKILGNTTDYLFWFVQVSDLHLSEVAPWRYENFDQFCGDVIPSIRPEFVLCSGDMVHQQLNFFKSVQIKEEWIKYKSILEKHGFYNTSFWIDVPGNHDVYGRPSLDSPRNYPAHYTVLSQHPDYNPHDQVFTFTYEREFGKYHIVYFDVNLDPGLMSPLNFHMPVHDATWDAVAQHIDNFNNDNHTLLMNHYPSDTLDSYDPLGRSHFPRIYKDHPFTAHLCGHLHVKNLKTRMAAGFLELELGDFMTKQVYRILAFDSDLFSFNDFISGEWPAILITNPKDARFLTETEPLYRMLESTHIRVLVFTRLSSSISRVSLYIDGDLVAENMQQAEPGSPLYTHPWDPTKYATGFHHIKVVATDANTGVQRLEEFPFSLDGHTRGISLLQRMFQDTQLSLLLLGITLTFLLFILVVLLMIPKITIWVLKRRGYYEDFHATILLHHHKWNIRNGYGSALARYLEAADDDDKGAITHHKPDTQQAHVHTPPRTYQTFASNEAPNPASGHPASSSSAASVPPVINIPGDNSGEFFYQQSDDVDEEGAGLRLQSNQPPEAFTIEISQTKNNPFKNDVLRALLSLLYMFGHIPTFEWFILVTYGIWFLCGIWFAGPLLGKDWGFAMLWGTYVQNSYSEHFIPIVGSTATYFCFPVIVLAYAPLVLYMALPYGSSVYRSITITQGPPYGAKRLHHSQYHGNRLVSFLRDHMFLFGLRGFVLFVMIALAGFFASYALLASYGLLSLLVSPCVLWFYVIALTMVVFSAHWRRAKQQRDRILRDSENLILGEILAREEEDEEAQERDNAISAMPPAGGLSAEVSSRRGSTTISNNNNTTLLAMLVAASPSPSLAARRLSSSSSAATISPVPGGAHAVTA